MPTSSKNAKEPTSTHHATTLALITSLEQNRAELLTTLHEIDCLRRREEDLRARVISTESLLLRMQSKPRATVFDTPELMHLIFSFAHSSEFIKHGCVCYPLSMDRTELGSQTLPNIIATVCKQWRRIAFAMTTLWSTIVIHTYRHSKSTCVPYLRRLDLYLIRSGSQPLTIFVEGTQREVVLPFLFRLRAHEERWKYVRLDISPYFIDAFLPISSPVLVALDLLFGAFWPGEADPPADIVPQSQSSIRSLSLDAIWVFKKTALPWQHLRALHIKPNCRSFPMEVFEWCHQLEYLSIAQEEGGLALRRPLGRDVVHTRLERLELTDKQEVLVFQELSLPSLHSLSFGAISNDDSDAEEFIRFIPRLSALTTLRIGAHNWQRIGEDGEPSGDKHARELLDLTSSTVQVLEIIMSLDDTPFSFLNFFRLSHLATHFPSLRELRLRMYDLKANPAFIHALLKLNGEINDTKANENSPKFSKIILMIEDERWIHLVEAANPTNIVISREYLSDWSHPGDFAWPI